MNAIWVLGLALLQESESAGEGGALAAMVGVVGGLVGLVVAVAMVAGSWKIFDKAGEAGWAALIPIYNYLVLIKICGRPTWWIALVLFCFPIAFIVLMFDLAKRFGKGAGFAIGLILFPFITLPMLGFGSATYERPPAA